MRNYLPLLLTAGFAPSALGQTQFTYISGSLPAQNIWTDGVAIADLDGDGDLDLAFANGSAYGGTGSSGAQPQHLFLGNGTGGFTAAHAQLNVSNFNAKMVIAEDVDNDGDLDLMYASGSTGSGPRLLLNNGSAVFTDVSGTNLPVLALRSFSLCAGDVDDDGDLDVVVTDGGTFGGTASQARLLINNGSGVFADQTVPRMPVDLYNCQDVTLFDYDGDFDIDIALSGKGATGKRGRLYLNDGSGNFTISNALDQMGSNATYEVEYGDLDGDTDLDCMIQSISGQSEGWGRNDGPASPITKTTFPSPNGDDDNEMAGVDYDNDGDLDVFVASLASSEKVYRNTGAVFAKDTTAIQAQSDASLDIGFGDFNGDGTYDMVTAQGESGNFTNKVYANSGPADTIAPVFLRTSVPAAVGSSETVFYAQTQDAVQDDGQAWGTMAYEYTVFGSTITCGTGAGYHMGGGQFRAAVPTPPGTLGAQVVWQMTDPAGNSSTAGPASVGNTSPFKDLGFALPGVSGAATLTGTGSLIAGTPVSFDVQNAAPSTVGFLIIGGAQINLPFFGGVLVPAPNLFVPLNTNALGDASFLINWPANKPDCVTFYFQHWYLDAAGPQGFAASNGLSATQPASF